MSKRNVSLYIVDILKQIEIVQIFAFKSYSGKTIYVLQQIALKRF